MQTGSTDEHQQAGGAAGKDNDEASPDATQHNSAAIGLVISQHIELTSPTNTPPHDAEVGNDRGEANASSAVALLSQTVTVAPSGSRPSDAPTEPTVTGNTASQNITVQQKIHNSTAQGKPDQSPPTATNPPSPHTQNIPTLPTPQNSTLTHLQPLPEITSISTTQHGTSRHNVSSWTSPTS